jgi:2C-methyl-D-erythritol 2,4-cyclodiphosphate synthase
MRIAVFIRKGEYKFYDLERDILEKFKESYKAKQWRIVNIDGIATKSEAIKYANEQIKQRIRKVKFIANKKKSVSDSGNRKADTGAYRIKGSLKNYYGIYRKLDATKLIGTRAI